MKAANQECNIVTIILNSYLKALYFDGGVGLALSPRDGLNHIAISAGTISFTVREIFNKCIPSSDYLDSSILSISGGLIGGALKYSYKESNFLIGAYNNAAYEAVSLLDLDPNLSTYLIEISDQIMTDFGKNQFSLKESMSTGFYVAFVLNGIANDLLYSSHKYIIEPLQDYFLDNNITYSELDKKAANSTIKTQENMCYLGEEWTNNEDL